MDNMRCLQYSTALIIRLRQKDEMLADYPDIVLGARFMDGSGEYQISAAKRLAFHLLRFMMRIAAGRKIAVGCPTGLSGA